MTQSTSKVRAADIKFAQPRVATKPPASPCPSINVDLHKEAISFTCFKGTKQSRLTKKFSLDNEGIIQKESQPVFHKGQAETVSIKKLSDIESIIQSLKPSECISTGNFDVSSCNIVTKYNSKDDDKENGIRNRSKEHMQQPNCGLTLFDYDPDPYMPKEFLSNSAEEVMAKMVKAVPELAGIGYSATGSSSNGIYKSKTKEPYAGGGGMHIYVVIKDISLEEFKQFLKVRLWKAGLGYISFARNGAMLERTLIDLSVLSPERLIFEASPVLGEGISQKGRVWTHVDGEVFSGGSHAQ